MKSKEISNRPLSKLNATCVVVANIIGTGVFTSLGFQAAAIPSETCILLLWVVGGFIAICGGLAYAELGSAMPRSGGEYHYLSKLYHPSIGFLSGWVSGTVAFAAPMALASLAFGQYVSSAFPFVSAKTMAIGVLLMVSLVHLLSSDKGGKFQTISTAIKLLPILFLIVAGLLSSKGHAVRILPNANDLKMAIGPSFAISLVYVSYAYSGWNASTYMASEIKNPRSALPISIIGGTMIVITIYVLLNYVFLRIIPMNELKGFLQVGDICSQKIFGETGRKLMGALIGIGLISSISSMILAGSRVLKAMGEDFPKVGFLAKETGAGNPKAAIALQTLVALVLLITATFEQVLTFIGFTLTIFTLLAVFGVYILRARKPSEKGNYQTWGYPYTPALFILFNLFMMVYLLVNKPVEATAGLITVLSGLVVYFLLERKPSESGVNAPVLFRIPGKAGLDPRDIDPLEEAS